jgi:subtilase family serine protease
LATQTADAPELDGATVAAMAQTAVLPAYHMAPALLDEPTQVDVGGTNQSASTAPRSFDVDDSVADIDTARLSRDALAQRLAGSARARIASAGAASTAPLTRTLTGAVFTPAQIRAAYGLPALPAVGAAITPAVAATLGAGQTIYLLDAYHDANALHDLNTFSARFGLPTCTNVAVAPAAALPLAKPPAACTFSAVYSALGGKMTATAPAYNATWAPESKLDVQWAHAIAPLARLVLIEMPNAMSNSILDGNALAAKLGAGVVSMSFGSVEAGWVPTVDSRFTGSGMTYVAAAGDSGSQVLWPAVSPNVVAVGGTGLNWSGSGVRYEAAWVNGGGGMSAFESLPAWQGGVTAAGGGPLVRRAVPDVAFNANPMTGEYVALTAPGATTTTWSAYGGTSIAAPQWAGVVAVANAMRVASSKAVLGDIHGLLYKTIAPVPGSYASAFGDVVDGTNGSCATCRAGTGFDQATGWGTPNGTGLLQLLTGVATTTGLPAAAPVVPGGTLVGKASTALSQSLGVTAPSGVTTSFTLAGAPSGVAVDSTGTLKWSAPVAGSYTFTVAARTSAGASAAATYSLKVIPGTAPAFSGSGRFTGAVGSAFSGTLGATNPNTGTLSFAVTGAPAGLVASTSGALSWAAPVAGTYTFSARVTDSYGYSATQTEVLTISAAAATNHAPTLASTTLVEKGTFAVRLSGQDVDGGTLTYTMTGAPSGAMLLPAGILTWSSPVKGTYSIRVTVRDAQGATGTGVITLTIS